MDSPNVVQVTLGKLVRVQNIGSLHCSRAIVGGVRGRRGPGGHAKAGERATYLLIHRGVNHRIYFEWVGAGRRAGTDGDAGLAPGFPSAPPPATPYLTHHEHLVYGAQYELVLFIEIR
ncbi:unnamed protein product [Leptosia nina]|uniref:Uncharacterized protein n=1 Tax=Leptosia nina TaxID=320188 RepID=A0AAV1IUM9_9NEOP